MESQFNLLTDKLSRMMQVPGPFYISGLFFLYFAASCLGWISGFLFDLVLDIILANASTANVAFLVVGDPFG